MVQWLAMVVAASSVLRLLSYLGFLTYIVRKTGGTEGLRDVAVAIRAFKFPIVRIIAKRRRTIR